MSAVSKYADPNLSRRIMFSDHVQAAVLNSFPMESKKAAPSRTTVVATPSANPYGDSSNIGALKSGLASANPYGDSSNIGALKSGLAAGDTCGLDFALSQQNDFGTPCDSFTLSPQAMLFNTIQDLLCPPATSAHGQALALMNSGMMPHGFGMPGMMPGMGPAVMPGMMPMMPMTGMGLGSPMQAMMNVGFGYNTSMNASWSFSSFSAFWGNGMP